MATEIVVPRLGWNMEEGVFMGWLKRDGDMVRAGEPLFTLEGDKSIQEIEAVDSGVLRIAPHAPKEGETVPVGTLLGQLEMPGDVPTAGGRPSADAPQREMQKEQRRAQPTAIVAKPESRHAPGRQAITPRARRAARERGIDTSRVQGTGRNGRIRERDILAKAQTPEVEATSGVYSGQLMSPARRMIAERMVHSLRTTAPVTLTTTADATNLVNLREQFKAAAQGPDAVVPSYTDFLVKLAALALRAHPHLNARWHEDRIVTLTEIHIGIAVDTEVGLLVPVVRNVPGLTLRQLALQTRNLAERARQRKLTADEMQGGTFTVTNLGAFGIDAFTPIINWPECAILGIGRIRREPVVVSDQIVARDRVTLSLTFDHRLVDGAPAARFLQTLCRGVENPSAVLVD